MTCRVCPHEQRREIDKALIMGQPLRSIAKRFGTSHTSIHRHRSCIADALERTRDESAFTARSVMLGLVKELRTLATACLQGRAHRDFLLVADRLVRAAEVFGKLNREIAAPSVEAFIVSLGVSSESDVRSAISVANSGRNLTLEDCRDEAVALLRMVLAERPTWWDAVRGELERAPSSAVAIESGNGAEAG